jgi:hypothetical protein
MTFFDCNGLRLLLEKAREPGEPTHASPIYFKCADISLAVSELEQRGVTFTSELHLIAPMTFFCRLASKANVPDDNMMLPR